MTTKQITQNSLPDLSKGGGHKFDHGHALVISGGAGRTGAARLAARAALRIGAGLVTVGSPRSAMAENAAHLTAIMLRQIDGGYGLSELLEDKRINAICLGPGLGLQADTQAIVLSALAANRPTVLDADGLSRFQRAPEALLEQLHPDCVLTPHEGEFARLFPDLSRDIADPEGRGDAVRAAAERSGCLVLLKGAETLIAGADGDLHMHAATGARAAPAAGAYANPARIIGTRGRNPTGAGLRSL